MSPHWSPWPRPPSIVEAAAAWQGLAGGGWGGVAGLGTDAVLVPRSVPGESDSGAGVPLWACSLRSVALCSVALCSVVLCSAPLGSVALCTVALAFGAGAIAAGLACGSGTCVCAAQIPPPATRRVATHSESRIRVTRTDPPRHSPPAILRNLFGW